MSLLAKTPSALFKNINLGYDLEGIILIASLKSWFDFSNLVGQLIFSNMQNWPFFRKNHIPN